jgi:hypothetical protein
MKGSTMGIALMIFGVAIIACGYLAKSFWGNWTFSNSGNDVPLPKWFGRLMFSFVGVVFVAAGLVLFRKGF